MFGTDYEYLRLSQQTVEYIQLSQDYIKDGQGQMAQRRIFNLPTKSFEDYEFRQIILIQNIIKSSPVHPELQELPQPILLKFLYATQFNINETIHLLRQNLQWLSTNSMRIDQYVMPFFQQGVIYLAGRDKLFRPTIVIDYTQIDKTVFVYDQFIQALSVMLGIAQEYMFHPGKIENQNIIIDVGHQEIKEFPTQLIQQIILHFQINFPLTLNKMFILNPSKSFVAFWRILSSLLQNLIIIALEFIQPICLQKIQVLQLFSPQVNNYNDDQVEQKFNGTLGDFKSFWPPSNTIQKIDLERLATIKQIHEQNRPKINTMARHQMNVFQGQVTNEDLITQPSIQAKENTTMGIHIHNVDGNQSLTDDHSSCPVCKQTFSFLKPAPIKINNYEPKIEIQQQKTSFNQFSQGQVNRPSGIEVPANKKDRKSMTTQTLYTQQHLPLNQFNKLETPWYMKTVQTETPIDLLNNKQFSSWNEYEQERKSSIQQVSEKISVKSIKEQEYELQERDQEYKSCILF